MMTHPLWTDEYWLLLMKLYLRKPEGVKSMYSHAMVDLSLELHIPPQYLYGQMFRLRRPDTPALTRFVDKYAADPKRLGRAVKRLRRMRGFDSSGRFYDGVEVKETFEKDFRPIAGAGGIMPVTLIIVLDLYFRLTPATMVVETPEVASLARTLHLKAADVVAVLGLFQVCDPYLKRNVPPESPLYAACRDVWQRYGNGSPQELAALAAQFKDFFK